MKTISFAKTEVILTIIAVALLTALMLESDASKGRVSSDIGCRVVRFMYDFESPAELVEKQNILQDFLVPEEFERLCADDPMRMVNAYYKFGYSASQVIIEDFADGWVMYRLINENIDPNQLWVFLYDLAEDGRLCNIREYTAEYYATGGEDW